MFLLHRWIFQKTDIPEQVYQKTTGSYEIYKELKETNDLIKRQQCVCDLSSRYAFSDVGLSNSKLSRPFIVSVCWNNKTYDMLVNDRIQTADILERLISLGVLIGEDAVRAYLKSPNNHQIFELEQYTPVHFDKCRLLVQQRERPSDTICISILGIKDKSEFMEVRSQDTIAILKLKVLIYFSILPSDYFLTFRGELLYNTQILADYNIKHESTVVCNLLQ